MIHCAVLGTAIKEALQGCDLSRDPGPESVRVRPLRTQQRCESRGRNMFDSPSQSKAAA